MIRTGESITVGSSRTRESSDRSLTTSATTLIDAPTLRHPQVALPRGIGRVGLGQTLQDGQRELAQFCRLRSATELDQWVR